MLIHYVSISSLCVLRTLPRLTKLQLIAYTDHNVDNIVHVISHVGSFYFLTCAVSLPVKWSVRPSTFSAFETESYVK